MVCSQVAAPATSMFDLDTADVVGVINRNSRGHSDQRCAIQLHTNTGNII
jgi:hypothetical protein